MFPGGDCALKTLSKKTTFTLNYIVDTWKHKFHMCKQIVHMETNCTRGNKLQTWRQVTHVETNHACVNTNYKRGNTDYTRGNTNEHMEISNNAKKEKEILKCENKLEE